jgi:hypothetical protein
MKFSFITLKSVSLSVPHSVPKGSLVLVQGIRTNPQRGSPTSPSRLKRHNRTLCQRALWYLSKASGQALKEGLRPSRLKRHNRTLCQRALWYLSKASGQALKEGLRQAPHGLRGTTALCAKGPKVGSYLFKNT